MLNSSDYNKILTFTYKSNEYLNNLNNKSISNDIDVKMYFREHIMSLLHQIFGFQHISFYLSNENHFYVDPVAKVNDKFFNILQSYNQHYYKKDIFHITNLPNHLIEGNALALSTIKTYNNNLFNEYFEILNECGYSDVVALPLKVNNQLIGGIGVYKPNHKNLFSNKEIELLSSLNKYIRAAAMIVLRPW